MARDITLYHSAHSRSFYVLWMLEELGVPYSLKDVNIYRGLNKAPEFLALNPFGKVPTLVVDGQVMTEALFICLWLADAYPEKGFAPTLDDPARMKYLRAFGLAQASGEAIFDLLGHTEKAGKEAAASSYGSVEALYAVLHEVLSPGPFVLGERFSAADVALGAVLGWGQMMTALPADDRLSRYCQEACQGRPAHARTVALDTQLMPEPPSFGAG